MEKHGEKIGWVGGKRGSEVALGLEVIIFPTGLVTDDSVETPGIKPTHFRAGGRALERSCRERIPATHRERET
jgi:hypothetical protein